MVSEKPRTTIPFSNGGYDARSFLNVAGREPEGTISKNDYEKVRDELIAGLKSIPDENGRPIGSMVFVQRNFTSTCVECA
jgi:predicted AlkP superfamily phosphohydrolase/phosphomutase